MLANLKLQDVIKILNLLKAEVQPSEELLKVRCLLLPGSI
jgi:hypothetical protein